MFMVIRKIYKYTATSSTQVTYIGPTVDLQGSSLLERGSFPG
jgi:hypothetical protein